MAFSLNLIRYTRPNNVVNRLFHSSIVRYSGGSVNYLNYDKDPAPIFFNPETQKLLKSITRLEFDKIFRKRTVKANDVEYKFLTTKQIEDEVRSRFKEAELLLQMPPVVKMLQENLKVLSNDPAMKGFSNSSFVFTDVTFGLKNSQRSIIIRNTDGVLEEAPYDVRKRIYQIYFPTEGRKFHEPKMFEADNMKRLLSEYKYEFLLDFLCLQYEPYEPKFHQTSSQIYQHVNENDQFDKLRSTRHFGPLAFFLAWHKIIDNLLLDMIRNDYLKNAVELICLMYQLNEIKEPSNILKQLEAFDIKERQIKSTIESLLAKNDSTIKKIDKNSDDLKVDEICYAFIQEAFMKNHALKKPQLELALQSYKERHNELKSLNEASGTN